MQTLTTCSTPEGKFIKQVQKKLAPLNPFIRIQVLLINVLLTFLFLFFFFLANSSYLAMIAIVEGADTGAAVSLWNATCFCFFYKISYPINVVNTSVS